MSTQGENKHMKWSKLVSNTRIPNYDGDKNRRLEEVFDSDYRRIAKSSAFRRLQDKTQVFPLNRNDFVRTRLTHSMEVALLSRDIVLELFSSIDKRIEYCHKNGYDKKEEYYRNIKNSLPNMHVLMRLLECSSLIHDLGNPPFGHFGEESIRLWFANHKEVVATLSKQQKLDFINYDGNAQTLRILMKLHDYNGLSTTSGMRLSASVLDTIIKYTASSEGIDTSLVHKKKTGYFYSEEKEFKLIKETTGTTNTRHPLTYILEAADDISYTISDIEDGYNNGLFDYYVFSNFLDQQKERFDAKFLRRKGESEEIHMQRFLRDFQYATYVQFTQLYLDNYDAMMDGTFGQDLFKLENDTLFVFNQLKKFCFTYIFSKPEIISQEIIGYKVIQTILDKFVDVTLHMEFDQDNQVRGLDGYQKRLFGYIPNHYVSLYIRETKDLKEDKRYYRLKLAVDFVSSMTDRYAKKIYDELFVS